LRPVGKCNIFVKAKLSLKKGKFQKAIVLFSKDAFRFLTTYKKTTYYSKEQNRTSKRIIRLEHSGHCNINKPDIFFSISMLKFLSLFKYYHKARQQALKMTHPELDEEKLILVKVTFEIILVLLNVFKHLLF